MRALDDPFAGIMRELLPPTTRKVIGADDSLAEAAREVAKPAPPQADYFSHLVAAHASQLADERSKAQAAIQDANHTKSMFGWIVAGALGVVVAFLLGRRK